MSNPKPKTFVDGFHDAEAVSQMPHRTLGGTGLTISALGFGGSALGGVFHDVSEEECVEVVSTALKAGVNIIDTAPWYGHGKAEEMLGVALKNVPREAYYLNTKVGRYDPDPVNKFNFSAARVTKSVDESLKRLQVQYIDIMQVHDIEFAPNLDIIVDETLPALEKLQAAGKIKMIGITGYPLGPLREVLERSRVTISTILSYSRETLFDHSLRDILPLLREKGVGLLNAAPTGMGLLVPQGPPDWHPASDAIKAACHKAAQHCKARGVDIARLALRTAIENEELPTTFISAAKVEFIKQNIEAATTPLSDKEKECRGHIVAEFLKPLQDANNTHWEGVELRQYWEEVGKTLLIQEHYGR